MLSGAEANGKAEVLFGAGREAKARILLESAPVSPRAEPGKSSLNGFASFFTILLPSQGLVIMCSFGVGLGVAMFDDKVLVQNVRRSKSCSIAPVCSTRALPFALRRCCAPARSTRIFPAAAANAIAVWTQRSTRSLACSNACSLKQVDVNDRANTWTWALPMWKGAGMPKKGDPQEAFDKWAVRCSTARCVRPVRTPRSDRVRAREDTSPQFIVPA